jgi:ATP-dependent RNA helicase RhlE
VHRIGRTARNGASGIAITLCDGAERGKLRDVEKLIRRTLPQAASITGDPSYKAELPVREAPRSAPRKHAGKPGNASPNGRARTPQPAGERSWWSKLGDGAAQDGGPRKPRWSGRRKTAAKASGQRVALPAR